MYCAEMMHVGPAAAPGTTPRGHHGHQSVMFQSGSLAGNPSLSAWRPNQFNTDRMPGSSSAAVSRSPEQ